MPAITIVPSRAEFLLPIETVGNVCLKFRHELVDNSATVELKKLNSFRLYQYMKAFIIATQIMGVALILIGLIACSRWVYLFGHTDSKSSKFDDSNEIILSLEIAGLGFLFLLFSRWIKKRSKN